MRLADRTPAGTCGRCGAFLKALVRSDKEPRGRQCAPGKGLLVQNRRRKSMEMLTQGAAHQEAGRSQLRGVCHGAGSIHTTRFRCGSAGGPQVGCRSFLPERPTPGFCSEAMFGGHAVRRLKLWGAGAWLRWSEQGPRKSCRSQRRRRGHRGTQRMEGNSGQVRSPPQCHALAHGFHTMSRDICGCHNWGCSWH